MSASCSIYNSSGGTKVTRTIFLFFGNFQNWVYQKGHVFFASFNWELRRSGPWCPAFFLCEASKKINCMRDQTIFYDTVYCPLMPTAFSPHYVSSNAQWKNYLIFIIFNIHCFSVNNGGFHLYLCPSNFPFNNIAIFRNRFTISSKYSDMMCFRIDPYKMCNINVVQSCWNFAQLKEIKK